MQIIIACVACAKRFVTNDARMAKEMVCPACGGAMKSAPRLNLSKPTKSHIVEKLEQFPAEALPSPPLKVPKSATDPAKRVVLFGGLAIGAILLGGIGWFVYRMVNDEESPIAVWSGNAPSRGSGGEPEPTGTATAAPVVVPEFAPAAPPPPTVKPKDATSQLAEFVEKYGDAVVRLTMFDGEGKAAGSASGAIIARRKVSTWIETEQKPGRAAAQGDLWIVATCYHEVIGASDVEVRLRDGTVQKARGLAAYDRDRDVALLALDAAPTKLTVLEPASRGAFKVGDEVIALGCSNDDVVGARGVVEALHNTANLSGEFREVARAPADQQWIESTALAAGGSGGPLLTTGGRLIGLNAWSYEGEKKLSAAFGVDHVMTLDGLTFDAENLVHRVQVQPFSAALPIELSQLGEDRSIKSDVDVRQELERSAKQAIENDWQPRTKGDYVTFQSVATMSAVAAARDWSLPETKPIADSLKKRRWDYGADIQPINRYAIENLADGRAGVFFFGKLRRISRVSPRHLTIDLTGRGYSAAVTVPASRPVPNVKVGDDVIVLGYRWAPTSKGKTLTRDSLDILAGLVLPVTLPSLPTDLPLQAAYDFARTDRTDPAFGQAVRQFADTYERAIPLVGKAPMRWQRFNLNGRGHQCDAVRITVPPGLNCDLVWSFNSPEESVEAWGVMPVEDFPMRERGHAFTSEGQPVSQLSKEESQHVVLQSLAGGLLVPGEDYLLWFTFKDAKPHRMALVARVVPTGSFDVLNLPTTGRAMQEGVPFPPAETAKMLQLLKERAATGADGKPPPSPAAAPTPATPTPTSTGNPTATATGTGPTAATTK